MLMILQFNTCIHFNKIQAQRNLFKMICRSFMTNLGHPAQRVTPNRQWTSDRGEEYRPMVRIKILKIRV